MSETRENSEATDMAAKIERQLRAEVERLTVAHDAALRGAETLASEVERLTQALTSAHQARDIAMTGAWKLRDETARAEAAEARCQALEAALRGVANSSCCGCCQEAAMMARAALTGGL